MSSISEEIIEKLRERYQNVHPLMFQRSVERAKTPGELFDILETIPKKLPIVWNEKSRLWETTDDIVQVGKFHFGDG